MVQVEHPEQKMETCKDTNDDKKPVYESIQLSLLSIKYNKFNANTKMLIV